MSNRWKVAVAMSGGVDSSMAAALLLEQGHEVVGLTVGLHGAATQDKARFCAADASQAAQIAATQLGIPHLTIDAQKVFEAAVLRPTWQEYARGRTPNPCILCNARIKFGLLLDQALALGAQYLATGHYARVVRDPRSQRPCLLRGCDPQKDQSYFLFALTAQQLEHALFPLGEQTKQEIRALAVDRGLKNAQRPESQDACFQWGEMSFAEGLRQRFQDPAQVGPFVDPQGHCLGHHRGIHHFTIGQRKGLGLALGQRAYVLAIDPAQQAVVVTTDEQALETRGMVVRGVSWSIGFGTGSFEATVQVRYRSRPVSAIIEPGPDHDALVRFQRAQRAVTPGQAAVFYQGEQLIGGGWIEQQIDEVPPR